MTTQITEGVKVSVETFYQYSHSRPVENEHIFGYRITIENQSDVEVQLLRRHWFIFDAEGRHSEVEGAGVVGEQPVLQPGEWHQYTSGCHLQSEIGKMEGVYLMRRLHDNSMFHVEIPAFELIAPFRLN